MELKFREFLESSEKKMRAFGGHADELNIDSDHLNKALEKDAHVSGGVPDFMGKDWKLLPWKMNPKTGRIEIMKLGPGFRYQASKKGKRLKGEEGGEDAHISSKDLQDLWSRGWGPALAAAQQPQQMGGMPF